MPPRPPRSPPPATSGAATRTSSTRPRSTPCARCSTRSPCAAPSSSARARRTRRRCSTTARRSATAPGPELDFAVDPVDGTTLTAKSLPNALAIVAVSERHTMFDPGPCVYMEKIAVAGDLADVVDLNAPIETTLAHIAEGPRRPACPELTVCILDRPRHEADLVRRVREAGSRIKFLLDGDVAGAIMAATPDTNVDLMVGIGGTPEGVLAACALKCLGGAFYGRLLPAQRRRATPRAGRRLRPRQGPDPRRHGQQRQRLRRRDGRHGRRAARAGCATPRTGPPRTRCRCGRCPAPSA